MKITNFESVRLGSKWPACADVSRLGLHEENGAYTESWLYTGSENGDSNFTQFRKHNSDKKVALFCFRWGDSENAMLPDHWKNSSVLWDSRDPE